MELLKIIPPELDRNLKISSDASFQVGSGVCDTVKIPGAINSKIFHHLSEPL